MCVLSFRNRKKRVLLDFKKFFINKNRIFFFFIFIREAEFGKNTVILPINNYFNNS
jgi:hypothetical protein